MSIVYCSMPHCIHRDKDGVCQSEVVELMFGIVMQLQGQGAQGYQRCAEHMTSMDIDGNK